jgi:predicted Zn finger-like uncharacterized protein
MPLLFHCPHCPAQLRVPDEYAGKPVRCPKCQALLEAPAAEGEQQVVPQPTSGIEPQPIVLELDEKAPAPDATPLQESPVEGDDWEAIASAVRSERIGMKEARQVSDRKERERDRRSRRTDDGSDMDDSRYDDRSRFSGIEDNKEVRPGAAWRTIGDGARWMEVGVLGLIGMAVIVIFGDRFFSTKDRADAVVQRMTLLGTILLVTVLSLTFLAIGHYRSRGGPNPFVRGLSRISFWSATAAAGLSFVSAGCLIYAVSIALDVRPTKTSDTFLAVGGFTESLALLCFYLAQTLFLLVIQRAASAGRSSSLSLGAIVLLVIAALCAILLLALIIMKAIPLVQGNVYSGRQRSSSSATDPKIRNIILIVQGVLVILYFAVLEGVRSLVRSDALEKKRDDSDSPWDDISPDR